MRGSLNDVEFEANGGTIHVHFRLEMEGYILLVWCLEGLDRVLNRSVKRRKSRSFTNLKVDKTACSAEDLRD